MKILFFIVMTGLGFVLGLLINRIAKYIVDTKSDPTAVFGTGTTCASHCSLNVSAVTSSPFTPYY